MNPYLLIMQRVKSLTHFGVVENRPHHRLVESRLAEMDPIARLRNVLALAVRYLRQYAVKLGSYWDRIIDAVFQPRLDPVSGQVRIHCEHPWQHIVPPQRCQLSTAQPPSRREFFIRIGISHQDAHFLVRGVFVHDALPGGFTVLVLGAAGIAATNAELVSLVNKNAMVVRRGIVKIRCLHLDDGGAVFTPAIQQTGQAPCLPRKELRAIAPSS